MKTVKLKLASIIALAVVFVITLGSFFGITAANADRTVTINGSSVFTVINNAEVWSHEIVIPATEEGEEDTKEYYTMFAFKGNNDSVAYRQNLAYNWFYNTAEIDEGTADDGESGDETEGDEEDTAPEETKSVALEKAEGFFNMEIGFELNSDGKVDFEKFIITFESQQFEQTKDTKTSNYIIFTPADNGTKLRVLITDDKEQSPDESAPAIGTDNIKIQFTKNYLDGSREITCGGGEYIVTVTCGETTVYDKFVNIGRTYARFSSSTTTPVTPLSFTAEYPEEDEDEPEAYSNALMIMYSLNGQSFKLENTPTQEDGHFRSGSVSDNTPPVLCLDKGVSFIGDGNEISFQYTLVDVIVSSPSVTNSIELSYFMLTNEQHGDLEFNPEEYNAEGLFTKVTDSDDKWMIAKKDDYIPVDGKDYNTGDIKVFDKDNFNVKAAVKVVLKLTDTSSTGGNSDYVMLDWFVDEEYLLNINGHDYIAVATDNEGAKYAYTDGQASDPSSDKWTELKEEYQRAVTQKVEEDELKAGNKNYFYLPSLENLISDNATKYEDLSFNIYYNNGSELSLTGKAYNELSINITKSGKYVFTVYATDSSSNKMYYFDKDGEKVEIETGDIWTMYKDEDDEGLRDYLPWFEFTVSASEVTIEEPKEQSIAYVGSAFTPDAFEFGSTNTAVYRLFRFEAEDYAKDNGGVAMTYDEFMSRKDDFATPSYRKYFTEIIPSSQLNETDEEYEEHNPYAWNASSPSFVPQDDNGFYIIECTVTGTDGGKQVKTAYMGIASAPQVAPLKGEDTWVQDNMASIILLCIAGASLIGIVLLLVIKPKDKGDLDDGLIETTSVKTKKTK